MKHKIFKQIPAGNTYKLNVKASEVKKVKFINKSRKISVICCEIGMIINNIQYYTIKPQCAYVFLQRQTYFRPVKRTTKCFFVKEAYFHTSAVNCNCKVD